MFNFNKSFALFVLFMFSIPSFIFSQNEKTIPDFSLTERKDIPVEYTWKIEDIYPDMDAWKADKEEAVKLILKVDASTKNWTSSPSKMLALLNLLNDIYLKQSNLYSYASNQGNMDLSNTTFQNMLGELRSIFVQFNAKLSFFNPDVISLGAEKFYKYLKAEPKLEPYRFTIENILRGKEHTLPDEQQKIASLTSLFSGVPSRTANMLNDVEIPPVEVTLSDGKKVTLNFANFIKYRPSKIPEDRTLVVNSFWANQKKFENTFAILLDGATKQHLFDAQIHKFPDCLEARLFDDNIPSSVYHNLVKYVRQNLDPLHRYLNIKKKLLKLDKYKYDDIYASAVPSVNRVYTFEDAKNIVLNATQVLGADYTNNLKLAFDNRWIDIYPNKGKQSGAYSSGLYGVHPFVKMNYDGTYYSVSTLAHELGHAMHSYFTDNTQHYSNSNYTTFIAEIASTFNENLLVNYILKNETDDLLKLYIIDNYLDQVRGTLYRQTLFAEFELAMHRRVEEGKSLTADWLNQKYLELTREYYGHDKGVCEVGDYIQIEWSKIPHFYYNFYVFQYSTGIIASLALSDMVLKGEKGAQEKYINLLKSGGSDYSIELLKKAGVDMTVSVPYESAFNRFNTLVAEMEKIVDRMNN